MANTNGLIPTTQVAATGDPNSSFFVLKGDPVYIEHIACDTLTANTIASGSLDLNGGALTTSEDGTVLTLNGIPVGSEGIISISGEAPISVSIGQNPVISLIDSTVVPGTYSFAQITVDSKGLITDASNGVIPANDDWSNFPAQTDVDMNGHQLDNVSKIVGDTSLTLSAATDITVDPLFGNFICNSKNVVLRANAPAGQEVSDSALTIETDNDISITATDALSITAGTMTVNNAIDMTSHKITQLATPTVATDAANKSYVDGLDAQDVKLTGDQSISGIKTFTTLPQTNIGATLPAQFVNKAYVDAVLPPTPGLGTVLNVSNVASKDIDMGGYDIANVNDITMNGLLPTITGSNVLGNMVIAAANTMNITTAGQMTLAAGGVMSIGGATYTTLENLKIDNSVITKEPGQDDLSISDVGVLNMTGTTINFASDAVINAVSGVVKVPAIPEASPALPNVLGYDTLTGQIKYQTASATPGLADVLAVNNLTGGRTIDSSTGTIIANELDVATIKALDPVGLSIGVEGNLVFPADASVEFQGLGTITSATELVLDAGAFGTITANSRIYTPHGVALPGNNAPIILKNESGTVDQYLASAGVGATPVWKDLPVAGQVNSVVQGTNITVNSTDPAAPVVSVDIKEDLDMKSHGITNATSLGFSATQSVVPNAANVEYNTTTAGNHNFKIGGSTPVSITTNNLSVSGNIGATGNITTGAANFVGTNVIRPLNGGSSLTFTGTRLIGGAVPVNLVASAGLQMASNLGTVGQYLKCNAGGQPTWETLPASGQVNTIGQGTNIAVNSTDPANPVVSVAISSGLDMNNNSITELKDITLNNGATVENGAVGNLTLKSSAIAGNSLTLTNDNAITGRLIVNNAFQTNDFFTKGTTSGTFTFWNQPVNVGTLEVSKIQANGSIGTAGQVLMSQGTTGNTIWADIPGGGGSVNSVSGVGNIAVNNDDPANPIVAFDVIQDIEMNNTNITGANELQGTKVIVEAVEGKDAIPLIVRSVNADLQLEASAGGNNIILVDETQFNNGIDLVSNVGNAPLKLQGSAGAEGQFLTSAGPTATPVWTTPANWSATPATGDINANSHNIINVLGLDANSIACDTFSNATPGSVMVFDSQNGINFQSDSTAVIGPLQVSGETTITGDLVIDGNFVSTKNGIDDIGTSANRFGTTYTNAIDLKGATLTASGNPLAPVMTLKGDIIPEVDNTYYLGSPDKRFHTVYVGPGSLWVGDSIITSQGTAIELPSGSLIGGVAPGTIRILGSYPTVGDLPTTVSNIGDSYLVTSFNPAHLFTSTSAPTPNYTDVGAIQGPQGIQGPVGPEGPPSGLYANTRYVNDNVNDIQTEVDAATIGEAIMISAGSYGGATLTLSGKSVIALIGPYRANGQTICELAAGRGMTIDNTCTGSITVNSLAVSGLLTLAGSGNYYFSNVKCTGGITISAGTTGNFFFSNCELAGLITVPATFGGVIVFGQSNMAGATYSLGNVSPLQVQFALCTNLPTSRPGNATYGSTNSDTSLAITTTTNTLESSSSLNVKCTELQVNGSAGTGYQFLQSQGAGQPPVWKTLNGSTYTTVGTVGSNTTVSTNNTLVEDLATNCLFNNSSTALKSDNGVVLGGSVDDAPDSFPYLKTFANQVAGSVQNTVLGPYAMVAGSAQTTPNVFNVAIGNLTCTPNSPSIDFPMLRNIAIGQQALGLVNGTQMVDCVGIGVAAGYLATAIQATFVGRNAGRGAGGAKDGSICIGHECGNGMAQTSSVAVGSFAARSMGGSRNIALGYDVGLSSSGSQNIYIGSVGCYRINGSNNIIIGHGLQANSTTATISNRFQMGTAVNPTYLTGNISGTPAANTLVMTGTATLGDLALSGATVASTAGASTGQYLRVLINGTYYKMPLFADV